MQSDGNNPIVGFMRHMTAMGDAGPLTDGQLLERFVTRRDEAAFEILLHRHGPMVLRVCRREVGELHAAEDAFQATFLVLVRKAASIGRPELLGNWLYGVAYRVARRARKTMSLRAAHERQEIGALAAPPVWPATGQGETPLVQEELRRLPAKYRSPMVLCYLEGRTNEEAAHQLQWPVGTVKVRLMRGREMLRKRLARRGLPVSGAALTTILSQDVASAAVPPALADATVRAALIFAAGKVTGAACLSAHAVALTEGVLKTMLWNKLKIVAVVLFTVGVLVAGGGWLTYRALAAEPEPVQTQPAPRANAKEAKRDKRNKEPKKVPSELQIDLAKAASETYECYLELVTTGKNLPNEEMCKWSARWLEAQLVLTNKKGDRIVAYTAHRDRMKDLEKIAKKHFDAGRSAVKDYSCIKYFLLEAEIWLARAKSGK